jgi:CRISPR system Cascade subunit CasB
MSQETRQHPFVRYLESLQENRAALATLRRGLGQEAGHYAPEMYALVVPRLPEGLRRWEEQSYYLIAGLYALHPVSTATGNIGSHLAATVDPNNEGSASAVERRFVALLTAHPDELGFYLRQAVSFLRARDETPVNWHMLMAHVLAWGSDLRRDNVQRQWANEFWRRQRQAISEEATPTIS